MASYPSYQRQNGGGHADDYYQRYHDREASPYAASNAYPPQSSLLSPANNATSTQANGGLQRGPTVTTTNTQASHNRRDDTRSAYTGAASTTNTRPSATSRGIGSALRTPRRTLGSGIIPSFSSGLFLAVVVVEAAAIIGLVVSVFGIVEVRTKILTQDAKTVPVFLALFVFGALFFVVIALDAFRLHNTIQIVGCVIYNIALLITASLEVSQVRAAFANQDRYGTGVPCPFNERRRCGAVDTLYPAVRPQLIATPIIIGVAQIPLTLLSFRLWQDFGWEVYKKIGADVIKRRMMLVYQIFVCFLKFDFFFGSAFCIAFLILVSDRGDYEFGLTIAALPIALVILFLSAFAVRKEIYSLMTLCIIAMAAGMVYYIWKLTRIFSSETEQQYRTVRLTLTFFSIFSIVSLGATIALAIWCTINFGKGLREAHESMGGIIPALDAKIRGGGNRSEVASKPFGIEYDDDAGTGDPAERQRLGGESASSSPEAYSAGHYGAGMKQQQQQRPIDEEDEDQESAYPNYNTKVMQANTGRYHTPQHQKQQQLGGFTSPPVGPQRRVSLD
ncbi:hypothetical protein BDZ90DRAFT_233718 [Jaminaea rosea]|uniref:Uncharacterized protein n=1 Tax=Jaminaea rosea TaxID=1569628 RepID=A0A316UKF7_9BASI|nr:hypothetical protein BDZ90DRAFT_233718 [Jaminaea rosea]PWN25710.1 hypothetical protein BDZ90DRAFT_233718 [Jaminaea rosea]